MVSAAAVLLLLLQRNCQPALWVMDYVQFSLAYYAWVWPQRATLFVLAGTLVFSLCELHSRTLVSLVRNGCLWLFWMVARVLAGYEVRAALPLVISAQVLSVSAWWLQVTDPVPARHCNWINVLNYCPDGVIIIGSTKVHCNEKALELLEADSENKVLQKLTELNFSQGSLLTLLSKDEDKQYFTDTSSKRIEWRSTKIDGNTVIFLRDFSRWRTFEKAAAEECIHQESLLRSISHELRTPINAIINLGEELRAALKGKELLTLKIISSSSRFLLSTVNDLLDCALISTGKFVLKMGPFKGEEMFHECVSMIEAQCKLKGIAIVLRYDKSLPVVIHSDHARLRQVLLSLLSNSVKFTLKGRIEVVVLYTSRHTMLVNVKDTGIGIPVETQAKLNSMLQVVGGQVQTCCLGLSISNAVIQQLSGRSLSIKSNPGRGSAISFEIPISENITGDVMVSGVEDESCMREESRGEVLVPLFESSREEAQVLIVDDSEFNRVVLLRILESNGYRCHQAFTGLQALIAVRRRIATGSNYKVILMDVDMPEMDGVTATRELREMVLSGELHSMPIVVACSAFSSADHEDLCLEAGMSYYLEKPISRDALLRLLSRLLPLECCIDD